MNFSIKPIEAGKIKDKLFIALWAIIAVICFLMFQFRYDVAVSLNIAGYILNGHIADLYEITEGGGTRELVYIR